jgi:hypothetical protein
VLLGLLAMRLFLLAAELSSPPEFRTDELIPLPTAVRDSEVRVGFLTLVSADVPGVHVAQGLGLADLAIAFRVAVIQHPDGTLIFGGAPAGTRPRTGSGLWNPFGTLRAEHDASELPPATAGWVVPNTRWYLSQAARYSTIRPLWVSGREHGLAVGGPTPFKYGIEADVWSSVPGLRQMPMRATGPGALQQKVWDVFGDQTVLALGVRTTGWEETMMLVTLTDGQRLLLVSDLVWTHDQLAAQAPRSILAGLLLDRNRSGALSLMRQLDALEESGDVRVIPLLDASVELPVWPGTLP